MILHEFTVKSLFGSNKKLQHHCILLEVPIHTLAQPRHTLTNCVLNSYFSHFSTTLFGSAMCSILQLWMERRLLLYLVVQLTTAPLTNSYFFLRAIKEQRHSLFGREKKKRHLRFLRIKNQRHPLCCF